ncbi:Glucan 1,3-beta-glucosidase 3 [Coemansia sp. RSA 552]|nr:Glucan 1,3-beta-glucosidase 3 [Coemansia sp. RSA 552]
MGISRELDELKERVGDFAPYDHEQAQIFRYRKQMGTNLGSMFCLEPWISTDIYAGYEDENPEAEGDLLECMGPHCRERMEAHWDSWVQRSDFERMASLGINAVRLPVGYWVLGHGFTSGKYSAHAEAYEHALMYIGRVIRWAAEFDIGVLIDIHAVPGGQNNDSHSGVTGPPQFYDNPGHQDLALKCYQAFTHLFANVTNIIGLQIINEPLDNPQLEGFYVRALEQIRSQSADLPIYIGDAWNLAKYAAFVKNHRDWLSFVVVDTHRYWVFRPEEEQYRVDRLTQELWEKEVPELAQASGELNGNLVVGEYSSVLANGSFDGEDPGECMGRFAREQLRAFDRVAAGTFYWTWRLQHDSWFWSMQFAIDHGAMPSGFFPFNWSTAASLSRDELVRMAEEHRDEWREQHLQGHKDYVSQWDGEFGFAHYAAGFDKGLDTALKFFGQLQSPSRLGFVKQLAVEHSGHYAQEHGGEQWRWEYEDAFREANEKFSGFASDVLRQAE